MERPVFRPALADLKVGLYEEEKLCALCAVFPGALCFLRARD
jgi:hypothetical protein